MAQAIGYVKSFDNGTFYVRDTKGNIRQLKVGEAINEGDHVYGAYANGADAKIVIDVIMEGAGDIVLAGDGALQFDSSLLANIFGQHDAVVHVNSLKEGLELTAAAEAAMKEKVALAEVEAGEETAAGEEVTDSERMADTFDVRTGLITDVTTDLRATAPSRVEAGMEEEPVILEDKFPLAVDDAATTPEDTPIIGNLAGNDIPSEDGGNVWTLTEGAQNGTVIVNPDGTFTYTPNPNYNGPDSFTYTITDADGDTSTATVTIDVTPVNDLSDGNEVNTVTEDTTLTVEAAAGVLANTVNPDGPETATVTQFQIAGDAKVYTAGSTATIAGVGELTLNADGSYAFKPAPNYAGPIPIVTYTVTDGADIDVSTLTLTMIPVNDDEGLTLNPENVGVFEAGLNPAGTAAAGQGEKASGSFTITDPDGLDDIKSVSIGGTTFTIGEGGIEALDDIVGKSVDTGYGTVTVTGYSNGTFTYEYVLDVNVDNDSVAGATGTSYVEKFTVTVSDGSGDSASKEVSVGITDDAPIFVAEFPQNSVIANVGDSDAGVDIVASANLGVKVGADILGSSVVISDPTPNMVEGINFVTSSNGNYVTSNDMKLAYVSDGSGGLNAVLVMGEPGEYTVTDHVVFSVSPSIAADGSVSYTTSVYDVIDKYTTLSVASEMIDLGSIKNGNYAETETPATAVSVNGTLTVTFEGFEDSNVETPELEPIEVNVQKSAQGIGVESDHINNADGIGAGEMLKLTFSQPIMGYMFTADQLDDSGDILQWSIGFDSGTYDGVGKGASNAAEEIIFIGTQQAYDALTPDQIAEIDYYDIVDSSFDTLQLSAGEDSSYRILPENVTVFYETDVPTLDFAAVVTDADTDSVTTEPFTVTFEGSDVLTGGALSDVLMGSSGSESLYGEGGNDTLIYDSADSVIDGGLGTDTLIVAGTSAIDISALSNASNIEVIDLTDSAGSALTNVTAMDILEITDAANNIYIIGDAGDQFDFADNAAWTQTGSDIAYEINGNTYQFNQYTSVGDPTVVVHVETEVEVL